MASLYGKFQLDPARPHRCMHHAEKDGTRCRATAMHNEIMCFHHRDDDIPSVLQNDPFLIARLNDRAVIQQAITDVAARLACNHMDFKRAGLLLQALQIATQNLAAHERLFSTPLPIPPPPDFAPDPILPPQQDEDQDADEEAAEDHYNSNAPEVVVRGPKRPRPAPAPQSVILPIGNEVEGEAEENDAVIPLAEDQDKDVQDNDNRDKDAVILNAVKDPCISPAASPNPASPQPTTSNQQSATNNPPHPHRCRSAREGNSRLPRSKKGRNSGPHASINFQST